MISIPKSDKNLIRIDYAGGSQTHQKDFKLLVPAIVKIFNEFSAVSLVIFNDALEIDEFPELSGFINRIENRKMVPFKELQYEIARFDINIAPLQINPFNEAKSELKYFEAALLQIPTIASPTQPFKDVIDHGKNGFLAYNSDQWYDCIKKLLTDSELRKKTGRAARHHVLWHFSPEQRNHLTFRLLYHSQIIKNIEINFQSLREKTYKFSINHCQSSRNNKYSYPDVVDYEIVKEFKSGKVSHVGVVIPLFNYERYILGALDSVKNQTLNDIDLVVVDDCSTDSSLQTVLDWMENNAPRFNNCTLLKNKINSKLSATRNIGFDYINSIWVMQLDADNELLPTCLEECLTTIKNSGAAMVYPQLELFGEDKLYIYKSYDSLRLSIAPWDPSHLARQNYIDAMAMVSKAAWAKAGGYDVAMIYGLEDWDFWLRFIEQGFFGVYIPKVLARYRVHKTSMSRTETTDNYHRIVNYLKEKHPWITTD
ncbi:MAG: glycosyltransferase [Bacteroidales bacterium]|nr:glycosyltransferase [Bacteroidales bacterium]MCF8406064.1 glycosyltransferase [Bacteroidales bacterium]